MKVFLSWSGPLSKRVAEEFHRWLPNVIQALKPWLSSEDIAKGAQWSAQITAELEAAKAGIIFVTPNNQSAPWLNFEAGAISNQIKPTKMVCTFLTGMKATDLEGPLSQFQATFHSEADVRSLLRTLNQGLEKAMALSDRNLEEAFDKWWPDLDAALTKIGSDELPEVPPRTDREIAEETLSIVRDLAKQQLANSPPTRYVFPQAFAADSSAGSFLPWVSSPIETFAAEAFRSAFIEKMGEIEKRIEKESGSDGRQDKP